MLLYIENPKDSTKKPLELINEFSKVTRNNINIQKSCAFLCVNNELTEREIKKTIPFTIASKIIKYVGINLTKDVKDLYSEKHKKEIEEASNKWKYLLYSWIGRINIIKIGLILFCLYHRSIVKIWWNNVDNTYLKSTLCLRTVCYYFHLT